MVSAQSDMEVVGSAASGEEIVALAGTTPCDVILMDIEMETIDAGIRAAEVITARHPEVKILFLTAHETDGHDHQRHGHRRGGLCGEGL